MVTATKFKLVMNRCFIRESAQETANVDSDKHGCTVTLLYGAKFNASES